LWPTFSSILPEQMPGARMLIVHDPEDVDASFARSAELAAIRPATTIVALPGAGHNGILTNPQTFEAVTGFTDHQSIEDHSAA
jgi:pimeloyl-ACP methyl ester carboxylesterase